MEENSDNVKNNNESVQETVLQENTQTVTNTYEKFSDITYDSKFNLEGYTINFSYDNNINYEFFLENRYVVPEFTLNEINYNGICNNGYTKLRTLKGNEYWLTQNNFHHQTKDWKFHVSVIHEDLPKAWNLLSSLFLYKRCWEGMKVMYLKENTTTVRGREITIYIYRHENRFTEYSFADEKSDNFWFDFLSCGEHILERNKITSNGCANGDLPLGKYFSLRNEEYVYDKSAKEYIYPPDDRGYNGAENILPFNIERFCKINNNESNSNEKTSLQTTFLTIKCVMIVLIFSYIIQIVRKWF